MSLTQFLRIFWARRAIILVAILACVGAAALVVKIMPTRYEAQSRVMLDLIKPDPVTGQNMGGGQVRGYVKTQTELIRDYRVAGRVVDALGWTSSPIYAAAYANRSKNDNRDFRRWVAQIVIDNTGTRLIEGSNILEITYTSTSAESARVIADALRQAFVEQTLAFKRDSAASTANWFRQQTVKLRSDLAAAQERKTQFERANGVLLNADNNDTEESRLNALAASAAVPPAAAMMAPAAAAFVAPSTAALAQIDAALAGASKTIGPNHPDYQALQRQRAVVVQSIARENAAARRVSGAVASSGPSLGALYSQQQARVLAQRGKVDEARTLAADVAVLRDQYNRTAARAADLEQQAASTETGITLLGSAVAPASPVFPRIPLIAFGSIGLGVALGVLAALLVELLSRRVRGAEDLTIDGIPVIGVMSREPRPALGLKRLPLMLGFQPARA